ncbi:MAG: hypothetical protein ACI8QZ_001774 [Chlamydiales bacterium]
MAETSNTPDPADGEAVRERLARLVGHWHGKGVGDYPTIDRFEYQEDLRFESEPAYPVMRYEQRTQLVNGEPSHWEFGFLRWLEDLSIEVSNVQVGGRVEVLHGSIETVGESVVLGLESVVLGHDARLVRTRRSITVDGDRLHYQAHMHTNTLETPRMLLHLEARLERR